MSSRLARLPPWVSHWLGYRSEAPKPLPAYQVALWSFIIAFGGLSVLQAIFNYSDYFKERHVPGIVASYVSGNAGKTTEKNDSQANRAHRQSSYSAQLKARWPNHVLSSSATSSAL